MTFPGFDNKVHGPCIAFAQLMAKELTAQNISFNLHLYTVTPGTYKYTFPNGVQREIPIIHKSDQTTLVHVIVEVNVTNGDKEETLSLDAGISVGNAIALGNFGDFTTGVIAPENQKKQDITTN